ncbi:MAG: glycerol-3-phosphate 1-O-acyltransferase PlsY [Fusobacterium sp.]|nr:glycerol-3-phosphate 1-O-acyltransferase PlsY [Fusobacterium sp.]
MISTIVQTLVTVAVAYVIGSIPTGYLIVKHFKGEDIRKIGSGSTGATNVKRVMGKKWFFITLFLDMFKGMVPVLLAQHFTAAFSDWGLLPVLAALAVLLGHSKSIFLGFTGGKSVASGVGTILALNWIAAIVFGLVWVAITKATKFVSLGSIIAIWSTPLTMFLTGAPIAYVAYAVVGAIYITYLHRENVQRLIKGVENKTEF